MSGLTRGRLYHYRLVATSDAGTSRGADQTFSTVGAATVVTGSASSIALTSARLNGTRHAERTGYDLVLRVRHEHELRHQDGRQERGLGHELRQGLRVADPPEDGDHLPLPPGRDECVRDDLRRRPELQHGAAAGAVTGAAQAVGATTATAGGLGRPQGACDDVVHGVRDLHALRVADAEAKRRLGLGGAERRRRALGPHAGDDLPLQARRDERRGNESRSRRLVRHGRRDARGSCAPGCLRTRASRCRELSRLRRAGEVVTVFAQPFGEGSFRSIATVLTAADGTWRYLAKPTIHTSYMASWNRGMSSATAVGVRPAVSLRRTAAGLLSTRVAGARSFAGRVVQLQRRTAAGRWVTIKRASAASTARSGRRLFRAHASPRRLDAPHRDERQPGRSRVPGAASAGRSCPPQLSRF